MKYLHMTIDGEDKEQLVAQLHFLQEHIQEGAISGSGYMDKEHGPSHFLIRKVEEEKKVDMPWEKKLRLKIRARGQQTDHVALLLEDILHGVRIGCCAGMQSLARGMGSANYIIYDRDLDMMEVS